jgi:hypothetical protein
MDPVLIPVFGMTFTLISSLIIFGFILIMKKRKNDVEKLRLQKEMKEIELRKEEIHHQVLIEENRKYDRIINQQITDK